MDNTIWPTLTFSGSDEDIHVTAVWPRDSGTEYFAQREAWPSWPSSKSAPFFISADNRFPETFPHGQPLSLACAMQIFWIPYDSRTGKVSITQTMFDNLLRYSNVSCALRRHTQSFAVVESQSTETGVTYCFSNHPKMIMVWSIGDSSRPHTVVCISEAGKIDLMRNLMYEDNFHILGPHPMNPALLIASAAACEVDQRLGEIKRIIREVEVRTGHHKFYSRVEPPALGDLCNLSATMSGCATKLASAIRKVDIMKDLCSFAIEQMTSYSSSGQRAVSNESTVRCSTPANETSSIEGPLAESSAVCDFSWSMQSMFAVESTSNVKL